MTSLSHPTATAFDDAFARGDIHAARTELERMKADHPELVVTRVADARLAAVSKSPEMALERLEDIVREHPTDPLPRAYFGSLLVGIGEPLRAISQLKIALAHDRGQTPSAHHAMGVALCVAGRFVEARAHLEVAAEGMPESASTAFYLGQCAEAAGDVVDAARRYARCCGIEPRYVDAWAGLARLKAVSGELDAAIDVVEAGLAHNPGDASLLRLVVQACFDKDDPVGARAALERIAEANRSVEDWANLAVLALRVAWWDEAERCALAAIACDEHSWWPRHVYALALEGRGARREAIIAGYENAMAYGDPQAESATRLGFILLTGEPEVREAARAVAILEEAAEKNGGAPGTLLNLALASENAGDPQRAVRLAGRVAEHKSATDGELAQALRILEALSS
jgi:tetratricopeptide (TPR) repeat protein